MLLIAVLSAVTGAAAGYTIAGGGPESSIKSSQESSIESSGRPLIESIELPVHYLGSASPSALSVHPNRQNHHAPSVYSPNPRYVLRTDRGFVTVFYIQNEQDQPFTLKERTRTPTSALSPEEQKRLSDGIYIYTDEQLIRILQDYDS